MTAVQAYERYRSSGLQWIPEIPDHWRVVPSWAIARQIRRPPLASEGVVTAFRDGQVTLRTKRRTDGFTEAVQEHGYQGVRRGELVIHSMDGFAGAIGVCDSDGKMSPVAHIYSVRDGEPRYFAHLLRVMALGGFVESLAKGIRERSTAFDRATFKSLSLPVPPIEEQRRILAYLDRETAQIDAFIAKNEELIALLTERRAAVIAQATTRGIRDDAELVESGLQWVGAVPRHWAIRPTRSVLRVTKSIVGASWAETPLLSLSKRGVVLRDIESGVGKFPTSFEDYQRVFPGDLVFCLFDVDETPRTVGLVRQFGMVTGAYTRCTVDTRFADPRFLELYFIAIDDEKRFRPLYTGLRNVIKKDRFLSARLVLPPIDEQRAIVAFVDKSLERIDVALSSAGRGVQLARERRAALISAVVTGKLDAGVAV